MVPELLHQEIAQNLVDWAANNAVESDHIVQSLIQDLAAEENLAIWAGMDPFEYLPQPHPTVGSRFFSWAKTAASIRNVMVFVPVAITWEAVSKATVAFAKFVETNNATTVNFLEFWQNGYDVLDKFWTIGNVASLDFVIILGVIALSLVATYLNARGSSINKVEMAQIEAERLEVALALKMYLYSMREIDKTNVKEGIASSVSALLAATSTLAKTAKQLSNVVRELEEGVPAINEFGNRVGKESEKLVKQVGILTASLSEINGSITGELRDAVNSATVGLDLANEGLASSTQSIRTNSLAAENEIPYSGDELLFQILHYDFYNIPAIEIAKITVEVNKNKYSDTPTSIRKLIIDKTNKPTKDLFDNGLPQNLKNISLQLEELISDVPNLTLQKLFSTIIEKAGVLTYIMNSSEKISLLQLLTTLFDFIKEETSRNPLLTLPQLISIIDLMEKEKLPISMNETNGTDKGVNLLTAHGSKGLEFEYIFFCGLNASSWEKKKKPAGGYKLPDTMFTASPTFADSQGGEAEELRRLFYVALTRAEKHLHLSYQKFNTNGKELEPSMFIAEILQEHNLPIEKPTISTEEIVEFEILQFTPQAPEIEHVEDGFVDGLLTKFVMNVTALSNYLKCPLQFYYQNLIRIPSGKSEATEFGSAIHHALEKLFRKMQENDVFPLIPEMLADFNWYMYRHRENFTKEAFERRMEYGHEVLTKYYTTYCTNWNKIVSIEKNIRGVVVNNIPLKGKLDKLEFNGKDVNVVDYKSGDIEKALPKLKGPNEKEPNGGDYWRQAVFYKILIDNYEQKSWNVVSTEFDFVEPNKKKEYRKEKIVLTPADTETVKQQITEVWQKVQNKEFYKGCGKETCHWCNFVKDNKLAVKLYDIEEDE